MTIGTLQFSTYPRYGTVLNAVNAPINIFKTFSLQAPVGSRTSDGYPNGTLAANIESQGSAPDGYYDKHVIKWNGQASLFSVGTCAIIYSNTGVTITGIANSCVSNNWTMTSSNSNGNRVVFKHGTLITGVSGGNGSAVVLSTVNQPSNIVTNSKVKISVGVSPNLSTGPNSDGTWTVSATGGNTITLANSTGVISPTVTGAGGPDVQSEIVTSVPGIPWRFSSGATYTNFNSLVWVKLANESLEASGRLSDPDYITQLNQLKPAWLRMMDISAVQFSWEQDFSARTTNSYICWPSSGGWSNDSYQVGSLTNSSDNFTCSAPPLTSTGAYKNGELIQGSISVAETTGNPTLNVNGRGAKRIIGGGATPYIINFPTPASTSGQVMQYAFLASWFNGGATYNFQYTTARPGFYGDDTGNFPITSGTYDSTTGAVVLTMPYGLIGRDSGQSITISALTGTGSVSSLNGTYITTSGSSTTNITFTAATGLGAITITGGNLFNNWCGRQTLQANVTRAMSLDATLNGNVGVINSGNAGLYPRTAQQGAMTISYSGPVTSSVTSIVPGSMGTGNFTFVFSYLHDAWLYKTGGLVQSVPLEYMVELCNLTNSSFWYTWPINTKGAYITAFTQFMASNLNSNLRFATEVGNEMWNFGLTPWGYAFSYGWSLGFGLAAKSQNGGSYGWTNLKTKQYGDLSVTAWTGAGRSRSSLYILGMSAQWDIDNTNTLGWNGSALTTSNTTYANYGGLDGASGSTKASSDYSTSPNRPIDLIDGVGIAPYWNSRYLPGGGPPSGTDVQNDALIQATVKYKAGNTSGAYTDLYNQFYTTSNAGPNSSLNLLNTYKNANNQQIETLLRSYDRGRSRPIAVLHYEAGPQFGLGNINNGTNDPTTDIPATAAAITSNGWNVVSYGFSDATDCATNMVGMVYYFKFSQQFYNLYRNYMTDVTTVHSGREACASQYGYGQSQWGLFPKSWTNGVSTAYSSYQAIADFNAGL